MKLFEPTETSKLVIVSFFLARITVQNVRTPSKVTCSINLLLIADIKKKIATKISNQKPNVIKRILGLLPVSENGKQRYEANIVNITALEKYNIFLGFIILNYLTNGKKYKTKPLKVRFPQFSFFSF